MILVAALVVTHRESLPAALVTAAPAAVIVLQAQEHHRGEDHLPGREAPQRSGAQPKRTQAAPQAPGCPAGEQPPVPCRDDKGDDRDPQPAHGRTGVLEDWGAMWPE